EKRETLMLPDVLQKMVDRRLLGDKTKGGFSRKPEDEIRTLDLSTFKYRKRQNQKIASPETPKKMDKLEDRLNALIYAKDRAGEFLWRASSEAMIYAANRIPEIADNIVEVDNAMKWGFAHELGVFETWDVIGVEKSVDRMREEGRAIPA